MLSSATTAADETRRAERPSLSSLDGSVNDDDDVAAVVVGVVPASSYVVPLSLPASLSALLDDESERDCTNPKTQTQCNVDSKLM